MRLVEGIEEIDQDNRDVDPSTMFGEDGRSRLRFGVASSNDERVVERLEVSCAELGVDFASAIRSSSVRESRGAILTSGSKVQPTKDRTLADMAGAETFWKDIQGLF